MEQRMLFTLIHNIAISSKLPPFIIRLSEISAAV